MATSDKGNSQKYFKYNYIDQVQHLVPEFYDELDFRMEGSEDDVSYAVLGKLLRAIKHSDGILPVSGYSYASSLYPFYLPENRKTRVTPNKFSSKILRSFGKDWSDFKNQSDFLEYASGTILPAIRTNHFDLDWASDLAKKVDASLSDAGTVQQYLVDNLGLMYFLNTSGFEGADPPSSLITSALGDMFFGETFTEEKGTHLLFEYFWKNREVSAGFMEYLPAPWNQVSANHETGNFTSGTQMLESLKTLLSVWTSKQDENGTFLKDSLELSILGSQPKRLETKGAMSKFLKAVAYGFYDMRSLVADINDLLDIENCPADFLDYLAHYVGWQLLTDDIDKWRNQLRQAIYVYKSKGTRNSIDYVMNQLIPSGIFDPNNAVSGITESWESYLPNMLYYLIRTESPYTKDINGVAELGNAWRDYLSVQGDAIDVHIGTNIDETCRFLVDVLLHKMHLEHGMIKIGRLDFRETDFWTRQENPSYFHRNKAIQIPPWEHDRFYLNATITPKLVSDLSGYLQAPIEGLGLLIPSGIVGKFTTLLHDLVELKDDGDTPLAWGDNQGFKFFTSAQEFAPNYQEILERGDIESASLLDFWNSKSSTVFTRLNAKDIDFESNEVYSKASQKIGGTAINTIIDVLRQFAPFHVINKIYVGHYLHDDYMIPQRRDFLKYEDASSFGSFDHPGEGVCAIPDLNGGAALNVYAPSGYTYYGLNTSGNFITTGVSATDTGDVRYMEWNTSSVTRNNITGNTEAGVPPAAHTNGANLRFNWAPSIWGVPPQLELQEGAYTLRYEVFDPGYAITGGPGQVYDYNASVPISSLHALELPPSGFLSWTSQSSLDLANPHASFPLVTSAVGVFEVSGFMLPWHTTNPNRAGDPYFNIQVTEPGTMGWHAAQHWGAGLNFSGLKIGNFELLGEFEEGFMFDKDYQNDGIRPSSIESIAILTEDTDYETQVMNSYVVSSFRGTSGSHIFKEIGHASAFAAPQQGRFIPSSTWHKPVEFWNVGAHDGASTEAPRDVTRRRNLRYALPSFPHVRNGFADVMSTDYMSASGLNPIRGKSAAGYLAKGFNFSSNTYYSTTGLMASAHTPKAGDVIDGVAARSYHASRHVPDMEVNASSIPTWRDQMGSNILRTIIRIFLRRSEMDERWLRFDEDFILDFKFGAQVTQLYSKYITEFGRQLRNFVNNDNPFEGGRNIIAHAFGPLLENHSFSLSGLQHAHSDVAAFPLQKPDTVEAGYPYWNTMFGGGVTTTQHGYYNVTGGTIKVATGQFAPGAVNTFVNPADADEFPNKILYSNSTLLSGIDIVSPAEHGSYIIWNRPDIHYRLAPRNPDSISFLTKKDLPRNHATRLRWKLDGGKNLFTNGDLKHPPQDATLNGATTSSVAGWVIRDFNRDSGMYQVVPSGLDATYATTGGIFLRNFSAVDSAGYMDENGPKNTTPFSPAGQAGGYSTKGFHITFSGFEEQNQQCQVGHAHIPTIETKVKLKPSTRYQMTFDLSATNRYGQLPSTFWNKTKNTSLNAKYPDEGTSWLATSSTSLKDLFLWNDADGNNAHKSHLWYHKSDDLSVGVPLASNWRKRGYSFTTPSNFEQTDDITFIGLPIYDADGVVIQLAVTNFELFEITPTNTNLQYRAGVQGNRLSPDTFYKMDVTGSKTRMNPGGNQHLNVRLITEPTPLVGHGVPNTRHCWVWEHRMWEPLKSGNENQWKQLAFTSSALETHTLDFSTKNHRTPHHYTSLASGVENIHTSSTAYYLEFSREETGPRSNEHVYNGVDLVSVEIQDMNFSKLLEDYTKDDFFTVFKYFDDLGVSKLSRSHTYSEYDYGLSGGSRSEYMEFYGGSTSATADSHPDTAGQALSTGSTEDAVYNFIEDEG